MIYQLTFYHGAKEYSIADRIQDKVLENQYEAVANGLLLTEIERQGLSCNDTYHDLVLFEINTDGVTLSIWRAEKYVPLSSEVK